MFGFWVGFMLSLLFVLMTWEWMAEWIVLGLSALLGVCVVIYVMLGLQVGWVKG